MTVVHKGEKPFSCNECGQKFARKERLKHHFERCGGIVDTQPPYRGPPEQNLAKMDEVAVEETQTIIIDNTGLVLNTFFTFW